jgi:hypothetical protein
MIKIEVDATSLDQNIYDNKRLSIMAISLSSTALSNDD